MTIADFFKGLEDKTTVSIRQGEKGRWLGDAIFADGELRITKAIPLLLQNPTAWQGQGQVELVNKDGNVVWAGVLKTETKIRI